jgi:hypothetical protein
MSNKIVWRTKNIVWDKLETTLGRASHLPRFRLGQLESPFTRLLRGHDYGRMFRCG